MSTWSEPLTRATVLRGGDAAGARPARMDAELRRTAFAPRDVVDPRLTDPHLQGVVERARAAAVAAGRAEGHAEGYAAGRAAAAAEAAAAAQAAERESRRREQQRSAQVQSALEVLATAADVLRQSEALALVDLEDVAVRLALDVARAVLDRELSTSTDPGGEALARALALAPHGCPVTARLHPDDAAAVTSLDELAAAGLQVVVVADPAVERGGCVAEAAGRLVDAQLGPAVERVAAVLR